MDYDRPRRYVDVVDAWRSTCPRLTIWEDACIDGLIDCDPGPDHIVKITDRGRSLLAGPASKASVEARAAAV